MTAMVQMIPRLQAEESLRSAYVQRIAGAVAGIVGATSQKIADAAIAEFNQLMRGLEATATGTAGQEVDPHGRPILRSAQAIREWFYREGGIRA